MEQRQEQPELRELLASFEEDEVEATHHLLQRIEKRQDNVLKLISTLNLLLNNKAMPSRQRRDQAAIARLVADSTIFSTIEPLLTAEVSNDPSTVEPEALLLEVIKLIGAICWQNPHFIDNIQSASSTIIPTLLRKLIEASTIPLKDDSLIGIVNFFHSISLKEGPVRKLVFSPLTSFLEQILTQDKFYQHLQSRKFNAFFSSLHKFYSNVRDIDKSIFNSLIRSSIAVNREYKAIFDCYGSQQIPRKQKYSQLKQRVKFVDRKLVIFLKLYQKSKSDIFEKIDPLNFVVFLKTIAKIAIRRPIVLTNSTYDNRLLVNTLCDLTRDIKDWKQHLQQCSTEMKQESVESKIFQNDGEQSQMQGQPNEIKVSRLDAEHINDNYLQDMKTELSTFEKIDNGLSTFSQNYYQIVVQIIDKIEDVSQQSASRKRTQEEQGVMKDEGQLLKLEDEEGSFLELQLQFLGSRLDRLLSLFMKMFEEPELMRDQYCKKIISRLMKVLLIYSQYGLTQHMKTVFALLPELNNMTAESHLTQNRFITEKLGEDELKTHLHLKITSTQNCSTLICDSIIKFAFYLSEYEDYLKHIVTTFLHPLIKLYYSQIESFFSQQSLKMNQVEQLRMMVKVVTELIPNIHKCNKEQIIRIKLYNYCLLARDEQKYNAFDFIAAITDLISKHDISNTEELTDTLSHREEMIKNIFVKLTVHKIRTFFGTTASFYQDLRKLSTPKTIKTPIGDYKLERPFMFEGHKAYVRCLLRALKIICHEHRTSPLKEDISGIILLKLFDFRTLDSYEAEDQQTEKAEEQYRTVMTKEFNCFLELECDQFFDWTLQNMHKPLHKLPMLIKKLLHYRRQQTLFQIERTSFNQNQLEHVKRCFGKVSEMINKAHFLIEGTYMDLGIKMKKKKIGNQVEESDFELKDQIIRLSQTCVVVSQFMIESNAYTVTDKKLLVIPENYINSLLHFIQNYLDRFEVETHCPEDTNYLILTSLWMIETYLEYKTILERSRQEKKKAKRKEWRAKKQQQRRKQKAKQWKIEKKQGKKQDKKDSKENKRGETEEVHNHKKGKKIKKSGKTQLEEKILQKNKSKINLHSNVQPKSQNPVKKQKGKEKNPFQIKVQEYIKFVLVVCDRSQKPLMRGITLQYILKFISANFKKNYLSKPPHKHFETSLNPFLDELLRIKIADKKTIGCHLILSRFGLKSISEEHVKMDYETGVKRYFFDNGEKQIELSQFLKFMEINFKKPPNMPHLIDILYQQPGKQSKKRLAFTLQNLEGFVKTGKTKDCWVKVKEGVDLNRITIKNEVHNTKRKPSNIEEQKKEKTIKLSEYVPEGDINIFVTHLITYFITKLIQEIDNNSEYLQKNDFKKRCHLEGNKPIEPFNIKTILNTLHYLIRQSPTLTPWVAKFKCKKIILNCLKNEEIKQKNKTQKIIFELLNKYDQPSDTICQIGFLQVLIRIASPFILNAVSGLVFELCLDSTPLVKNKVQAKEGQKSQPNYISFGSVVRQKTLSQLESILFGGNPSENLIRKASCLNLMTVLMNNREMARLFIESSFISKLYSEYTRHMSYYSAQALKVPGVYQTLLYIPFFLEPISLLQELNIAFHHNKKLNKSSNKLLVNSLIMLTQESINQQLIPADVLKKNQFRNDWPFTKKEKVRRPSFFDEGNQNQSDNSFDHISGVSDSSGSDDQEESHASSDIEEGLNQLDHMAQQQEQEQSYVSFESGHQSHLLDDEWDYSNNEQMPSDYPDHDDHIIEQEIIRELNQNDSMPEEDDDEDLLSVDEDDDSEFEDDLDQDDIDDEIEEDEDNSYSEFFSGSSEEEDLDQFSPRQQLIIQHKEEEEFYQHVLDVVTFEKISVIPKISKIEGSQIFKLRFFLQMFNYPQRELENKQKNRIKTTHETLEEKKVQQSLAMLTAFKNDKYIQLCHHIQWNQVYRYDFFQKLLPTSEAILSKMFSDQHGGINQMRKRRNAVIHRGEFIEVVPAVQGMPGGWEVRQIRRGEERRIRSRSRSSSGDRERRRLHIEHLFGPHPIRIVHNEHLAAVQSQSPMQNEQEHISQLSGSIPQEDLRQMSDSPRENDLPNFQRLFRDPANTDQEINRLLRELNMNMTAQEFRLLGEDIQEDIVHNYFMGRAQRDANRHQYHPNTPIRIVEEQRMEEERENQRQIEDNNPEFESNLNNDLEAIARQIGQELAQARIRQDPQMSPLLGRDEANPQIPRYESQSLGNHDQYHEQYRKMSMQHISKLNKDIMQTINKDGRNNSKFHELSDHQLAYILEIYTQLSEKEHKNYPFNLVDTFCMNTKNMYKFVSSNMTLLSLFVREKGQYEAEIQNKSSEQCLWLKRTSKERELIVIKILHLLYHLTSNYSISMHFLKNNSEPIQLLERYLAPGQAQRTSLEMLILILDRICELGNPEALKFNINVIENITVHHFYKSIHTLISKPRQNPTNQASLTAINDSIQITKECAHCLGSMLQKDVMKDHLHSVSRIIMRLSLNEVNLTNFIRFMETIISELTRQCLSEVQRLCQEETIEEENKRYIKIVNLMNIFFEMVISFKTYPTSPENHALVLGQLRKIVEIEDLQILCQTAVHQLFTSRQPKIQTIMGEILEVYFILYEIAIATSNRSEHKQQEDSEHKHIAELGEIKEMRKYQSSQLKKQEEEIVLGKFNLSKLWRESINHPVFKTYINNCIKKKLNNIDEEPTWMTLGIFEIPIFKVAISTPHMLTFDNKRLIFKTELKRLRKKSKYHMMHMVISRQEVFEDTYAEIMHYQPEVLKGKLKIEFKDEEGEDAGGITRQWFQLLSKKMFDPNYGLFKSGTTGNTFHPSEKSYINPLHLKYFKFIGRITGKALYDGYLLDAYFTPAFYKHILNLPITYLDMELEDYEYYNSLKWIMENSPIEDYLELNFNYNFDNFGEIQSKELFPGGGDKVVTEENKLEYVQLSAYAKMATSIKGQLQAFLEGFHDLIPHRLIKIFNEKELEIMISGRPTIDIDDLRRNTELINYVKNDQIILWLFQVLESFDMELRTAFLQFVTGSSKVPVQGFKDLRGMNGIQKFNIHREFQEERLPRAHTCFNQLDLPNYKSKEILIEKLMLAITEGKEGFHMI